MKPVRVMLLAPDAPTGGIASWQRTFRRSHSDGIEVDIVDTSLKRVALGSKQRVRRAVFGSRDALLRAVRVLRACAGTKRPDIVYLTCAPSLGFKVRDLPLVWALHVMRVPAVLHLHGGSVSGFFGVNVLVRKWIEYSLRRAAAIICITDEVKDAVDRILGSSRRIHFIPNMLDANTAQALLPTDPLSAVPGPHTIIHVAWQARDKGSLEVVHAAARLPQHQFLLVGPVTPEMRSAIRRLREEARLPSNVKFTGQMFGGELIDVFRNASLLVHPSYDEGFPMVVLEAMAAGLPVIATDVGHIRRMIGADGPVPAGIILKSGTPANASEIAFAVEAVLEDPNRFAAMREAGLARINRCYSSAVVAAQLEAVVRGVLSDRRRSNQSNR